MRLLTIFPLAALATASALATRYDEGHVLVVERSLMLEMDTSALEIERNGERVEPREGMDQATTDEWLVTQRDEIVEAVEREPRRVRRAFEVSGSSSSARGERSLESPFDGITLELSRDEDGETRVEVLEGQEPDADGALDGQRLGLALDAFLGDGELEVEASWDLENDAIRRGLGLTNHAALFPRAERAAGEGRPAGGRGAGARFLLSAKWEGEARLTSLDAERDGSTCALITLELEASGQLEELRMGGRGRERALAPLAANASENSYSIELEGELYFDLNHQRPLELTLSGPVETTRTMERSRGDQELRVHIEREGTLTLEVSVTAEDSDE